MRYRVSSLSMGFIFALSACNSGEEIPQKSDKEELEDIINTNIEVVEQEAKSIRQAAAQAVKIIEQEAQAEIDKVKLESDEAILESDFGENNPPIENDE